MFTQPVKTLPPVLTSHDVLKSFALITMVIDHIGVYIFPEQMAWRIVGRMSLPVWLFLVGYANSRNLGSDLITAGLLLLIAQLVFGEHLLPLHILFTIMLVRLLIDRIMAYAAEGPLPLIIMATFLGLLAGPTIWLFEYGTHAFLFAMLGYLVRHRAQLPFAQGVIVLFAFVVSSVHAGMQAYLFQATAVQSVLIWLGVVTVAYLLTRFRAQTYPVFTARLHSLPAAALMIMGRHTLGLYVVHLLVLKALAAWLLWDHDWLFDWQLFMTAREK